MRYRNVLCDLDGTLTDPFVGIDTCIRYALEKMQRRVEPGESFAWTIGPPIQSTFGTLLGTENPTLIAEGISHYRYRFDAVGWSENEVYPGIREVLSHLTESGLNLYVATLKPTVFATRILAHFELADFFIDVVGCGLDGSNSTKAEVISRLRERHGFEPSETLMIGDRDQDVLGAAHHGIPCLGVTYGYGGADELRQAGAMGLCDSPAEWLNHI